MGCVLYVLYGEEDCGMDWVIRTRGGTRLLSHISSRHTGHPHGAPTCMGQHLQHLCGAAVSCASHIRNAKGAEMSWPSRWMVHTYMYGISRYDYRAGRKQGAGV